MKILICEGEEILLTAIEFRLRKQGFDVEMSKNGTKTLQQIRENRPDLLLIDMDISDIPALELVQRLKAEYGDGLPVILIAEVEDEERIMQGFRLGAGDFVSKPFKPSELVIRVRRILENKHSNS